MGATHTILLIPMETCEAAAGCGLMSGCGCQLSRVRNFVYSFSLAPLVDLICIRPAGAIVAQMKAHGSVGLDGTSRPAQTASSS